MPNEVANGQTRLVAVGIMEQSNLPAEMDFLRQIPESHHHRADDTDSVIEVALRLGGGAPRTRPESSWRSASAPSSGASTGRGRVTP
jgi:hypothetical protein